MKMATARIHSKWYTQQYENINKKKGNENPVQSVKQISEWSTILR